MLSSLNIGVNIDTEGHGIMYVGIVGKHFITFSDDYLKPDECAVYKEIENIFFSQNCLL